MGHQISAAQSDLTAAGGSQTSAEGIEGQDSHLVAGQLELKHDVVVDLVLARAFGEDFASEL